jgi:putative peptide zinc metalloprotease protein
MTAALAAPTGVQPQAVTIPPLRQELRIERGAPLVDGAPSWTLFDPLVHAFYQLGRTEFTILSAWASGAIEGVRDRLARDGLEPEEAGEAVGRVVEFSLANNLTLAPMQDTVATFTRARAARRRAWWKWMVDNYLFFRLPLVRPAAFLERTLPRVAWLFSPITLGAFAMLALLGLFLVARQWDVFLASFPYFFTWDGAAAYGAGLIGVKLIHELGHAYTATRYGCRVPTMGVSFLVMMPVLYTDTTGAWRLTSRRKRLLIDSAGVIAELMVATLATLAWVVLPDGPMRSIAFVTATTSWIMSLAVNLSPLMRFDGYYILSDWLGVPNLQNRGFALGRWRLRELLFGLGEPPPEPMPTTLRRILIVYAWVGWVYRLVLFLGIALLVYHFFFKTLGLILFAVEMGVFIVRPIWNELSEWRQRRSRAFSTRRGRTTLAIVAALALLAVLPLDRHVSAPAVLAPVSAVPIVAGEPARVDRVLVADGARVRAGQPLVELSAPDLLRDTAEREARIGQLRAQLDRSGADEKDMLNRAVTERSLAAEQLALAGVGVRRAKLVLRAPVDGVVVDLAATTHPGRWLGGAETLARVVAPGQYDVQAFVDEREVGRLAQGADARFIPNDSLLASRPAKLIERSAGAIQYMDQPMLGSIQGGPIAVTADARKSLRPEKALYRLRMLAAQGPGPLQPVAGTVRIRGDSQSVMGRTLQLILRVFRAEASLTG